ncbi:hypothetical protein [Microbacterium sp. GXF6406]
MKKIQTLSQAELLAQRDEFEAMMYAADARVYTLSNTSLVPGILDFPLPAGEISYVWTGHWDPSGGMGQAEIPKVTIAASSLREVGSLRSRLRLDRPTLQTTDLKVNFEGRSGVQERGLVMVDTQHVFAEFEDGDTSVILAARSIDHLPEQIAIRNVDDISPLVESWKAL